MSQVIQLDPLTRIEGHLAFKVETENGRVGRAYVSGEMFRGIEVILRGRDPLDAQQVTQRICGVCSIEHGVASVLAQEAAYGARPAPAAVLARNLMQAANMIQSHITHFYLLSALDFVDVAAVARYGGNDPALNALKAWVKAETSARVMFPAAPFLPRYVGQYLSDPATNFSALRHYLGAFEMRALAHRMAALFAGKAPHAATLVPGGITEVVTPDRIAACRGIIDRLRTFVDTAYLPDVVAVAEAFPDYFQWGRGCEAFLSYGVFPESGEGPELYLPGGILVNGQPAPLDPSAITEDVAASWFSSPSGLRPAMGRTEASPKKSGAYSWLKAPRYQGQPMEVGPLARLLVAYHAGEPVALKAQVDGLLQKLKRPLGDLVSVMGRHAARAIECKLLADHCAQWAARLLPGETPFHDFTVPDTGSGFGLTEAARGALGHWISLRDRKIANYQCVVPTTWNCSPRDDRGVPGPVEQALVGVPVADPANPIEPARVVRSFDPCLACAVH